jgi:hypothetical protein
MIIEISDRRLSTLIHDPICRLPFEREMFPKFLVERRWYASGGSGAAGYSDRDRHSDPGSPRCHGSCPQLGKPERRGRQLFFSDPRGMGLRPAAVRHRGRISGREGHRVGVDGFSDHHFVRLLLEGIRRSKPSEMATPRFL